MRIVSVRIKNFRGYRDEVTIKIDDLTVLIGKNDAGKSTILDMLVRCLLYPGSLFCILAAARHHSG